MITNLPASQPPSLPAKEASCTLWVFEVLFFKHRGVQSPDWPVHYCNTDWLRHECSLNFGQTLRGNETEKCNLIKCSQCGCASRVKATVFKRCFQLDFGVVSEGSYVFNLWALIFLFASSYVYCRRCNFA